MPLLMPRLPVPRLPQQREWAAVAGGASWCDLLPDIAAAVVRQCADGDAACPAGGEEGRAFDAGEVPQISVADYLIQLCEHGGASPAAFSTAGMLLDRAARRRGAALLRSRTAHRLLLAAFVVAAKIRDDRYRKQSFYARLGGVPAAELCGLERAFLRALDWELAATREQCARYAARVRRRAAPRAAGRGGCGALPFAVGSPPGSPRPAAPALISLSCTPCDPGSPVWPSSDGLSSPASLSSSSSSPAWSSAGASSPRSAAAFPPPAARAAPPPPRAATPPRGRPSGSVRDVRAKLVAAAVLHSKLRALPPGRRIDSDLRTAAALVQKYAVALAAPQWHSPSDNDDELPHTFHTQ